MVFLLFDDPRCALQNLQSKLRSSDSATVLRNWASNEENVGNDWQQKMQEALCVIQNYRILKKLGKRWFIFVYFENLLDFLMFKEKCFTNLFILLRSKIDRNRSVSLISVELIYIFKNFCRLQ